MKVELLVSRAGVGFAQNVGDEIEVSDAEGERMIAASQAVEVAAKKPATRKKKVEAAAKPKPETR
jgi:hypothetical protein